MTNFPENGAKRTIERRIAHLEASETDAHESLSLLALTLRPLNAFLFLSHHRFESLLLLPDTSETRVAADDVVLIDQTGRRPLQKITHPVAAVTVAPYINPFIATLKPQNHGPS